MKLFHFSSQTEDQQLNNLHQEFEDPFFSLSIKRIVEKIDVDDSQVFLISSHKPQAFYLNSFAGDKDLIIQLHEIWHQYINNNDNEQESCKNNFWVEFNKFGKHVLTSDDETLFLFHSPQEQQINTYFLLLKNKVLYLTIIKYLFILSLFRHLQIGQVPLHASAVIINDQLFLFSGPSGAGKTTITTLLSQIGGEILDEDRVMMKLGTDGKYYVKGWGSSIKSSGCPIRAIFKLSQSNHDHIIKLSQLELALFLIEQSQLAFIYEYSAKMYKPVFQLISQMARCIPGYQLHFQKKLDFWQLIKGELSV